MKTPLIERGFPFLRKNSQKSKSFSCNFGKIGYSIPQTNGETPDRRYFTMGFESYRQGAFTRRLADLPDQPNMQAAELKTYFDSSPEELRQALNRLCDALGEFSAAAKLGYTASAGVPAQTVQDAIENVQKQVRDASVGKLPSGCVDGDKLAQDVRNRLTAIEHAAESETNARTAADADLQSDMNTVKTTLTVKTECHFGTYTGDGTEKRTISLGYHPKAVLVFREGCYTGYSSAIYGGLASEDVPLMYGDSVGLGVTADGFQLLNSRNCALNLSGYKYSFAVFA